LEHDDYFVLNESALMLSRIQFIVNGEDLYRFQVENSKFDGFIKSILRTYGGAFDQFINIKEMELASKNRISKDLVIKYLQELDKLEVVSYQQQTNQPLLTFVKPRFKTEDLLIDSKYFAERKENYHQKMMSTLAFVERDKCRSVQLLNYFDETDAQKCGICDVCLTEKRSEIVNLESQMTADILNHLKNQSSDTKQLLTVIKKGGEKEKLSLIRTLLDAGVIHKKGDEYYT